MHMERDAPHAQIFPRKPDLLKDISDLLEEFPYLIRKSLDLRKDIQEFEWTSHIF